MLEGFKKWWRDEWFKADPEKYGHHVAIPLINTQIFQQVPNSFRGKYGGPRFDNTPEWDKFLATRVHIVKNRYDDANLWKTKVVDYYFSDVQDAIEVKLTFL